MSWSSLSRGGRLNAPSDHHWNMCEVRDFGLSSTFPPPERNKTCLFDSSSSFKQENPNCLTIHVFIAQGSILKKQL